MTMHPADSPGGHRHSAVAIRLAVVLATAGCAVALCACGSSGGGGTAVGATTATGTSSPLGRSRCLRAHGIPTFAAPPGGGGEIVAGERPTPGTITPALWRGVAACEGLRKR